MGARDERKIERRNVQELKEPYIATLYFFNIYFFATTKHQPSHY